MDFQMSNTSGLGDEKLNRKRRAENLLLLDNDSTNKRLRRHQKNGSLLDLNDDCLLEVFKQLNRVDLCYVHNACTRFVPLAERAFKYALTRKPGWTKFNLEEHALDMRLVFYKFGHLCESVDVTRKIDGDLLTLLTQLTFLKLVNVDVDSKIFRVIHTAQNLKEVIVADCNFDGISKTVHRSPRSSKGVVRTKKTPLLSLTFQSEQQTLRTPSIRIFSYFLQYNQRLQCLGLPIDVPDCYITHILKRAKQLSELNFYTSHNSVSTEVRKMMSKLTNLRKITVSGSNTIGMCGIPLLEGIEQNAPKLTHLGIRKFIFKEKALDITSQMKNLQHLSLAGMFDCLKSELVSLVAALPLLDVLLLELQSCCPIHCGRRNVNFNVLKGIVDQGKQLSLIKIWGVREIQINENNYAELVEVREKGNRKEKLSIEITGCASTTEFNVPMYLRRNNVKCLTIDFFVDKFCDC